MDRDLLAQGAKGNDGDTIGGLPAARVPQAAPTLYTYKIYAGFVHDGTGALAVPMPEVAYIIGTPPNAMVPGSIVPDAPLYGRISLAVSTSDATPTVGASPGAEVPDSWELPSDRFESGQTAFPIPVSFLPPQVQHLVEGPFWLRLEVKDDAGCVTTAVAYFADGIHADADVTTLVSVNGGAYTALTARTAEVDAPDLTTLDSFTVTDEPGVCPAPPEGIAVWPAGGKPLPVSLDVPVDVHLSEDTPLPVSVTGTPNVAVPGTVTVQPAGGVLAVEGADGDPLRTLVVGGDGDPLPVAPTWPLLIRSLVLGSATPAAALHLAIPVPFVRIEVAAAGPAPGGGATAEVRLVCGGEYELVQIADGRWGDPTAGGRFRPLVLEAPAGTQINDGAQVDASIDSADPDATLEVDVFVYRLP